MKQVAFRLSRYFAFLGQRFEGLRYSVGVSECYIKS